MQRFAVCFRKMLLLFFVFNSVWISSLSARHQVKQQDSLITTLKSNKKESKNQVIYLLYKRFYHSSAFDATQKMTALNLKKYDAEDAEGLIYFLNALINYRKAAYDTSTNNLMNAIVKAQESDNNLLLYHCYTNLAFIRTAKSDVIGAIHAYRLARKHAMLTSDSASVAKNALGIAMVYNKVEMYHQALTYLNKAKTSATALPFKHGMLDCYISYHKAEIYFKIGTLDSLQKYAKLVTAGINQFAGVGIMKARAKYFCLILEGKYEKSVPIIKTIFQQKQKFEDANFDRLYLAQSYYQLKRLDSAKITAEQFTGNQNSGTSMIKFNGLRLLAEIAMDQKDVVAANRLHKQAMLERDAYVRNLIQVGDISEQMRLNDLESSYQSRTLNYERQRSLLFFAIALIILVLVIIVLLYRNVVQKRRYEKLADDARTEELATLNSHQVRRHLANIMGICDILKETETVEQDLNILHHYLNDSAVNLDECLKVVEKKLSTKLR